MAAAKLLKEGVVGKLLSGMLGRDDDDKGGSAPDTTPELAAVTEREKAARGRRKKARTMISDY